MIKRKEQTLTAWYWYKDRYVYVHNRIPVSELNPYSYGHLSFAKVSKTYTGKKKTTYSTSGAGKKSISILRKMKRDPYLSFKTKI